MTITRARNIAEGALYTLIALAGIITMIDQARLFEQSAFVPALFKSTVVLIGIMVLINAAIMYLTIKRRHHDPMS